MVSMSQDRLTRQARRKSGTDKYNDEIDDDDDEDDTTEENT